ncbi:MAG: respiratory nitrate reductase subunit gamma [Trueperaceae bacterium]|nr:respiratory nitrate reductase subunit gamma [Trueperaceae bacterium]MCO5173206.1 respiratory nitrate reductase subunit gamma [Trueperaceae bacterium]MCW5818654.1 respiratory nitrate reductase subunit gamma [Trueperaceae bacterium]
MSLALWAVYPYLCMTLFFVVPFIRLRKRPFEFTTRATTMFNRRLLGAASLLFHWGIILLLVGHAIGIVGGVLGMGSWVHAFFWIGIVGGFMALSGSILAVARRLAVPELRALSQHDDYGVHILLIAILSVALYQSVIQLIWGAAFNAGLWLASLFRFQPEPELMAGAPLYTQIHVFLAFTFLAYFPFTKLVHAWTLPVNYLVRPYQSMRTARRKFQRRFELALRTDTSVLTYSIVTVVVLLLAVGFLLPTPGRPRGMARAGTATNATTVVDLPGYALFLGSCARCHGVKGDGQVISKTSPVFAVPPRNLTQGRFRFVSTTNGVASDTDLQHTVQHGLPAGGMPGFPFLSDEQLASLVQVIDHLWVDRPAPGPEIQAGPVPQFTPALVSRGSELFATNCSVCHGPSGAGDGPAAANLPVRPADLAAGRVKAGTDPTQLYYRVAAGIPGDTGAEMPSFAFLPETDIWSLVAYLKEDVLP